MIEGTVRVLLVRRSEDVRVSIAIYCADLVCEVKSSFYMDAA
jgi:hypothetical protein